MIDSPDLSSAARRVQLALNEFGLTCTVLELAESTRTAEDAARAAGCQLGQIVKSLVFRSEPGGKAVLVLTSGSNRVDEKKVAVIIGEKIVRADADFVRATTGYAIGGIPPIAHANPMITLIDEDLLHFGTVWAAAGTPHAVFEIKSGELERITNGKVCQISRSEVDAVQVKHE